jgi:hypothetical protein
MRRRSVSVPWHERALISGSQIGLLRMDLGRYRPGLALSGLNARQLNGKSGLTSYPLKACRYGSLLFSPARP